MFLEEGSIAGRGQSYKCGDEYSFDEPSFEYAECCKDISNFMTFYSYFQCELLIYI